MKKLTPLPLITLLLSAVGARGDGLTYTFQTKLEAPISYELSGEVWIDGARVRMNFLADGLPGARIEDPGAGLHVLLDPGKRTYWDAKPGPFLGPFVSGSAVVSPIRGLKDLPSEPEKLKVEEKDLGPGEPLSARPTKKVLLNVSYERRLKVSIDTMRIVTSTTIALWLSDDVPAMPFRFGHGNELRPGIEKVDVEIEKHLAARGGFPLKHIVTTTQTWDKSAPSTRVLTTTLSDLKKAAADPTLFAIPQGYRHEEPTIGFPSR